MHLSIFLFFAGLMVLMWNESTVAVCIVPSIACALFVVYYVVATVRSPFLSFFQRVKQFDDNDFRGLRVQIWTPFTLGTHHTLNYFFLFVVHPLQTLVRYFNKPTPQSSDKPRPSRPVLRTQTTVFSSTQKEPDAAPETHQAPLQFQDPEALSPRTVYQPHTHPVRTRGRSPLSVRTDDGIWVDSPPGVSRVGTPLSHAEVGDMSLEDVEFRRKLKATRMRRLTEHEIMRSVRSPRGNVET
ncbi:transmembrane protein [Ceratobasidium sp. AG-Ba]|nr:transmembrane protein [Ceratobasidium sp. AG-Ba]